MVPPTSVPSDDARNIRVFGLTSLLNDTASEMAYWVLPAFLASIGAGPAQLGIIEGIAESVASSAKLFSGYLADRVTRRKPLVVAGYAVANAVKPLLALAGGWSQVLLIRFTDRFAKGIRGTARDVMVADSVGAGRIGSAFGWIQAMDSAGAIAGPLIALSIVPLYGVRGVFWGAAVPGALAVSVIALGLREKPATAARRGILPGAPPLAAGGSSLRGLSSAFYYVLAIVTLFSLGNSSDMFLVLRSQSIGIGVQYAPLLGLAFNITYTAFSWPAGRLSDRVPRRVIAAAGYAVFAIVYFCFGWAPSRLAIWLAMAAYGLFYALTTPVLKALVVDTVSPSLRGRALGIYYVFTSLAALLSSVLTGQLWKHYGPRFPFYLSAGLGVLAASLLLIPAGKAEIRPDSPQTA